MVGALGKKKKKDELAKVHHETELSSKFKPKKSTKPAEKLASQPKMVKAPRVQTQPSEQCRE